MEPRLGQQIRFLVEIDRVKHIFRQTKLFDGSRQENDAEHSWHLAVMALVLSEYANQPVDVAKVIKMVLLHDIVEIDVGDVIIYDRNESEIQEKEKLAAQRIFGLLPDDLAREFRSLWEEFEKRKSPEAQFAGAIDRLEPILQNYYTNGHTWLKNGITRHRMESVNRDRIADGSQSLWKYVEEIIEECHQKGLLK